MSTQHAIQHSLEAIPGLFAPQREFMIHNASDDEIVLGYDGETFTIPSADQVVEPHHKFADTFCSGRDSVGNLIPGTLIVRDKIDDRNANADLEGNRARGDRWDAAAAVRHCLGVDPKTKIPGSVWYERGISLLPIGATPDLVKATQKAGAARWEKFRLHNDRELVNSVMAKSAKEKALGFYPTPPPAAFEKAQQRLLVAASAGIIAAPAPVPNDKAALAEALLEDEDFLSLLKEKLKGKGK